MERFAWPVAILVDGYGVGMTCDLAYKYTADVDLHSIASVLYGNQVE